MNEPDNCTRYMCAARLKAVRCAMGYMPRDMRQALRIGSRRTYEDYEAGRRRIPLPVALKVRELFTRDQIFMASIGPFVDMMLANDFPKGLPAPKSENDMEAKYETFGITAMEGQF